MCAKWRLPEKAGTNVKRHMVTRELMIAHHLYLSGQGVGIMIHDCNEPYAESGVVYDESIKLWRFSIDRDNSGPVSYCPFCGEKLQFEQSDLDAYREREMIREEESRIKHSELMKRMNDNQPPNNDDDDIPEHNPLIKSP